MQRHAQHAELLAGTVGLGVTALHAADRRQGQPGLRLARIACEQALELGRGAVEFVQVLLDRRLHQQHVERRRRRVRPGPQHGERLTGQARIALGARLVDVAPREPRRERVALRLLHQIALQAPRLGACGTAAEHLDHLRIVARRDRHGAGR